MCVMVLKISLDRMLKDAIVIIEPYKSKKEKSEKNTRPDLKIKIGNVTILVDVSIIN